MPHKYLEINLFKGRVTVVHLASIVETTSDRTSAWMGKLMSLQGRVILVRHVLSSMFLHSMAIFRWPHLVIKEAERLLRNFLWSGDPTKRKLICVSWVKTTKPLSEGGLGIRRLKDINKAILMKLAFDFLAKEGELAIFLRNKYLKRDGDYIKGY